MLWPLDPGFGCAMRQPVPARPELPTTTTTFHLPFARVKPSLTPMRRGRLPKSRCRHATRVDGLERSSGRNASPSGITPSNISSPAPEPTRGSWTEVSPGARAQRQIQHAHAPPNATTRDGPLTPAGRISKRGCRTRGDCFAPTPRCHPCCRGCSVLDEGAGANSARASAGGCRLSCRRDHRLSG